MKKLAVLLAAAMAMSTMAETTTYNVINIAGRTNPAGQKAECLRCVSMEFALDRTGVNGPNLPYLAPHVLRLKFVSFADTSAHAAGKQCDPTAAAELDIDVDADSELSEAFETVFAKIYPKAVAKLGGAAGTVTISVSSAE